MSRPHLVRSARPHRQLGRSSGFVRLVLAVVTVASALGAGVLLTPSPAVAAVGWQSTPNDAPLPTLDTPDPNPLAAFSDVACASDGTCVALGTYSSASGALTATTLDTTYPGAGGVWSATEPPLPVGYPTGAANQSDEVFIAVACYNGSPGTCVAVGTADDGTGNTQGVIDTFSAGTWSTSVAPLPPGAATGAGTQFAWLNGVTCPSAGTCVAVGGYSDGSAGYPAYGLVDTLSSGMWSATQAPAPGGGSGDGLYEVACASVGTCVAVGGFTGKQPFVDNLASGIWTPSALPLPTNPAAASPTVGLYALACASDNTCAAIGKYSAAAGGAQAVYSSYAGGQWSVGLSYIRLTATNPIVKSTLDAVACPSAGTCVAVGAIGSHTPPSGAWLETFSGGTWSQAFAPVPGGGSGGDLSAITCAADGTCAAVGSYDDVAGNQYALVDTYQSSTWSADPYPPSEPTNANPTSVAELTAVTCPTSVTSCAAFGDYEDTGTNQLGLIDTTKTGVAPTFTIADYPFTTSSSGSYTVTLSGGSGTPTGSVIVADDQGNACASPIALSGGSGSCTISAEAAGSGPFMVTAYYSGDSVYLPSATSITVDPEVADGSGNVTASAGAVTATVSGGSPNNTVVTAAQYGSDPVATSPPDTSGDYVDVALTNSTISTSVMIIVCSSAFSAGNDLYWYNAGSWTPISPTTFTAGSPGCLSVTLTSSTTPAPGQLIGTVFAAGSSSSSGLHITTTSLPLATARVSYRAPLAATGGNPPYKWSVSSGSLPKGLHLSRSSGVISGRPGRSDSGTSFFVVKVVDKKTRRTRGHPSTQNTVTAMFGITVS